MMDDGKRKLLCVLVVALLIFIGGMQSVIDPIQLKIQEKPATNAEVNELMVQLPGQFIVASATGFKEVISGALWVRADSFFHTGQYQAIIPIVRLVTWLDPHNIDVYTTGAWHLDYNFVDQNEMSDKRYIPAAIALLKEGIKNNPGIWDLWFELGWTHYNKKVMDYQKGLECIKKACELEGFDANTGKKIPRPEFVDRMLAHQYEKVGMFKEAINEWYVARKRIAEQLKKKDSTTFADQSSLDVCDRNLGMLYMRLGFRYGDMDALKKGVDLYKKLSLVKNAPPDVKAAYEGAAKILATGVPLHDTAKPLDTGFQVTWTKMAPKVFLLRGKLNLCKASEYKGLGVESITNWYRDNQKAGADSMKLWRDGTRVRWMITDYDYKIPDLKTFSWKIDTSKTVVWDSTYVSGGTFSEKIDLSKNAEFYPFKAKKYKLTVWWVPQQSDTPDFIQDRIGWKGEAITDKNYLDTKTQPGFRLLRYEKILDKKDVL